MKIIARILHPSQAEIIDVSAGTMAVSFVLVVLLFGATVAHALTPERGEWLCGVSVAIELLSLIVFFFFLFGRYYKNGGAQTTKG
jgi:hypothetical protein